MATQQRRDRERAETRNCILDAARNLFVRNGYEATTMRAIARHIEYTPAAIYHYFPSKEALLLELSETDFQALAAAFQRIGRVEDPMERLDRIGAAYVEFALTHPMHYQLLFMTRRPPMNRTEEEGDGDPSKECYSFLREAAGEAISRGRLRPEYDDPDEVAQMLWASLHGIVSLHVVKQHDDWIHWRDVQLTAEQMRAAMLRGIART